MSKKNSRLGTVKEDRILPISPPSLEGGRDNKCPFCLLARKCAAQIVRALFLEAWPSGNSVLEFKSLRFRHIADADDTGLQALPSANPEG